MGAPLPLHLHRSNRVDVLAHALGDVLEAAPLPPLVGEIVLVHGRPIASWLSMQLAQRFGIWAHASFPFPRRFVLQVMRAVLGEVADALALDDAASLQWLLLPALDRRLDDPGFVELRRYCRDDPTGIARFQLAARTAALFESYLVHRPAMMLGWEQGDDDQWQAQLWRDVVARRGPQHFARLHHACVEALQRGEGPIAGLPPRVSLFGVASMPPSHLTLVTALARRIDVHLFVPSPSRAWWAELRSHRRAVRARDPAAVLASDEGHPLLASLGTLGREFQGLLEDTGDYREPRELYVEPDAPEQALGVLQGDILDLRVRGEGTSLPAMPLADDDDSIAVFSCHSRLREVEVLHDRLHALLAADPSLQPRDIVVYLTDVDAYAPLVEAVFERERDDPTAIPCSIADRSPRAESPTLEAWLRLLALVEGRMSASDVLDLLVLEPVALRFGFTPDELDTIAEWVANAGIRWGIDAAHRRSHGQPGREETTWAFGLRRMLLGYAMPGHQRDMFAGVLPFDDIEGSRAELLGRLCAAMDTLFRLVSALAAPRCIADWRIALDGSLSDVLAPRPTAQWELDDLRAAIAAVDDSAARAEYDGGVPLAVMRDAVLAAIDGANAGGGLRAGRASGVCFCALAPMRVMPAEVVCVLGLSDGAFPRGSGGVDFDLMRRAPAPGDRHLRDDDRYAFLEALMAARRRLLLGYVGQSSQDDRDLPPSVVLAELLDLLGATMVVPGTEALGPVARAAALRRRVVVRQPMQPFSPRNFGGDDDPRLFSFEASWCAGANALQQGRPAATPGLFARPLSPWPDDEPVQLERLVRMFQAPQHELLKRRLQVNLREWERERSDREPMELDGLNRWRLGDQLLGQRLEGLTRAQSHALLASSGALPLGAVGDAELDALLLEVDPIAAVAREACGGDVHAPVVEVDLTIGARRLLGHLRDRHSHGLVVSQYSRPAAKHIVALWIHHLVACALAPGEPVASVLFGRDEKDGGVVEVRFETEPAPLPLLANLIERWSIGMREPLLFFPRASLAFCERFAEAPETSFAPAMTAARNSYRSRNGEGEDEAVRRIFGDADPLAPGFTLFDAPMSGGDFVTLAIELCAPLVSRRR